MPHSPIWHSSLLLISICSFLIWMSLMRTFDIICINICHVTLTLSLVNHLFGRSIFHHTSYCHTLLLGFSSLNHWRILDFPWNYLLKVPDSQKSIEALPEKIKKNTRVKVKIQKLQVNVSLCKAQFHGESCPVWEEGILVPSPSRFFLLLDSSKLITARSRFYLVKQWIPLSSFHPTTVV